MKVNSNDWHYRIVHFPDVQLGQDISWSDKHNDFCSYTRWFLWKLLVVIPVVCIFIGVASGAYIGGLLGFLSTGTFHIFSIFGFFTLLAMIFSLCVLGVVEYDEYSANKRVKEILNIHNGIIKEPGFLTVWYRKLKEKYCPSVTYTKS